MKNQANINNSMKVLSQEELGRRIAAVETDMKSSNWKELDAAPANIRERQRSATEDANG